jgi:hypothetical protein
MDGDREMNGRVPHSLLSILFSTAVLTHDDAAGDPVAVWTFNIFFATSDNIAGAAGARPCSGQLGRQCGRPAVRCFVDRFAQPLLRSATGGMATMMSRFLGPLGYRRNGK